MRYFNSRFATEITKRGKAITKSVRRLVLGIAASAALLATGHSADAAGVVNTPDSFFPVAVWSQPMYTFDKWQSRGINTLFKFESYGNTNTIDQWSAAANSRGLYQIREPRTNPALDASETRLLAWMHADEPDIHDTPPSVLAADFARWRSADATKPILVNYSGGELLNGSTSEATYKEYSKYTNWVSSDLYPVTGWNRPDWMDKSKTVTD